uniref:Uncharacterized protein n=1 Tax=Ascaris lumbricoides TaxID=6252 RepID=A0A9J2P358_ASCLU
MVCQACKSFQAQLALKDEELKEVGSKFATYKLKSKGRLAQLKQSITEELPDAESWQKERAALLIRLAESENELDHRQKEAEDLRSKLATKETELSDHSIRIRSLEEQLRSALDRRTSTDERRHPADLEEVLSRDLERMHSQMVYKDTRIMELNNTILDKERQILDLQEMCREQGQLVQAKSRAFQIVQQRFLVRLSAEISQHETDPMGSIGIAVLCRHSMPIFLLTLLENNFFFFFKAKTRLKFVAGIFRIAIGSEGNIEDSVSREQLARSCGGSAPSSFEKIVGERMSPPPADPSEDRSSFTTETTTLLDEADAELKGMAAAVSTPIEGKRKQRKKVTFDLTPQTAETPGLDTMDDEIAQAIIDLTAENDQLRRTIQEMESSISGELQTRIDQHYEDTSYRQESRHKMSYCNSQVSVDSNSEIKRFSFWFQLEEEVEQVRREGRNQALKARAAAQGRIRDLEEKIAVMQQEQKDEVYVYCSNMGITPQFFYSLDVSHVVGLTEMKNKSELSKAAARRCTMRKEASVERLNANVETLRAGREWTLEENGRLLEQLAASKQKFKELREELDESNAECENLRTKLAKDRDVIVKLADDVDEAQRTANLLFEQKVSILDDVDRLKEAIEAQGEYIEVLEADVVIYEEHIGILRDSLGASKVENRKLIKSKAFETKLKALEQEKEQMTKRNNGQFFSMFSILLCLPMSFLKNPSGSFV